MLPGALCAWTPIQSIEKIGALEYKAIFLETSHSYQVYPKEPDDLDSDDGTLLLLVLLFY